MRVATTKPLFAWDCLDDGPNIKTITEFLRSIPDGKLLASLRSSLPMPGLLTSVRHPSAFRRHASLGRITSIRAETKGGAAP